MKTLIMSVILGFSVSSFAKLKNEEYGKQAATAAKAINAVNWGLSESNRFEVINEDLTDDGNNLYGTYKVRLFIKDKKTNTKSDGGKDFDVYIFDGAVLNVKVDCRMCG